MEGWGSSYDRHQPLTLSVLCYLAIEDMPFAVVSLCSSGVREPVKTLAPSVKSHFYSVFLRMGMELAEKKKKKKK